MMNKIIFEVKQLWVLKNVDLVIENIDIINRKKANSNATYDFTTLYITNCDVIDFAFESGNRTNICISKT